VPRGRLCGSANGTNGRLSALGRGRIAGYVVAAGPTSSVLVTRLLLNATPKFARLELLLDDKSSPRHSLYKAREGVVPIGVVGDKNAARRESLPRFARVRIASFFAYGGCHG
jgi:hypothetical protein